MHYKLETVNRQNLRSLAGGLAHLANFKPAVAPRNGWRQLAGTILTLVFISALLLPGIPAYGQGGRATITGALTDQTGAAIPDVEIAVLNTLTGQKTSTTSTSNGTYVVALLPIGTYKVTFSGKGFRVTTREGVVLTPDQVAVVNETLTVGELTQTLSVTANAEMLETSTAALGQAVTETAMLALPLNGRNPATLVFMSPGAVDVTTTAAGGNQAHVSNPNDSGASVSGGRQGATYYLLDGANNMDSGNMLGNPFPNADATDEFRVLGNNFNAQYGFAPVAVVSVVTKSGTNQWHGVGFGFLRNYALDAADYFSHLTDTLRRPQYGGAVGGPIQRNKLFIFGNYQRTQQNQVIRSSAAYVPNNAQLGGDFSNFLTGKTKNLCGTGGPSNLTFDTGQMFAANGTPFVCPAGSSSAGATVMVKQPFLGNQVPVSMLDPITLKVDQSFAHTSAPTGLTYLPGIPEHDHTNEFLIRGDYSPNEKNRISGRVFYQHYHFDPTSGGQDLLAAQEEWDTPFVSYSGSWTWTARPDLVNNFVFGWNRDLDTSSTGEIDINGKQPSWAGYGANIATPPLSLYPPSITTTTITGYTGIPSNTSNAQIRHSSSFSDSVSWTKGQHLVVVGADIVRLDWWDSNNYQAVPVTTFDGETTGNAIGDFLLGYVDTFNQGGGADDKSWNTNYGFYVQDTIRVTPRFTVNVGLRWEPYFPATQRDGRVPVFLPGEQSTRYPNAPLGLVFPGDKGITDTGGIPSDVKTFLPRLGIAWQPKALPHTSIRAAGGIFEVPFPNTYYQHDSQTSPFSTTTILTYATNGPIKIDNPWASFPANNYQSPYPPFSFGTLNPASSTAFIYPVTVSASFRPDFHLGKTEAWNFSIQHELTPNMLVTVAYVGSETYDLPIQDQRNPGIYAAGGLRTTYPQYASVMQLISLGTSSHNGVHLTFEKRFSHGLQITSNYAWSKTLDIQSNADAQAYSPIDDAFNLRWNHGISDLNFPRLWVTNLVWLSPTLKSHGPLVSAILGSWQPSAIVTLNSGRPFSVTGGCNGNNNSLGGQSADRADLTGQPLNLHSGSQNSWVAEYFNTAAFQCNAPGTFGNEPRNYLTGPALDNSDIGVDKDFHFKERYRIEFRWEMFNAFNTPHFALPGTNPSSTAAFGKIVSTASPGRIMQGGLKFHF
jgi:hypothetical protein